MANATHAICRLPEWSNVRFGWVWSECASEKKRKNFAIFKPTLDYKCQAEPTNTRSARVLCADFLIRGLLMHVVPISFHRLRQRLVRPFLSATIAAELNTRICSTRNEWKRKFPTYRYTSDRGSSTQTAVAEYNRHVAAFRLQLAIRS